MPFEKNPHGAFCVRSARVWHQKRLEQGPWDPRTDNSFSLDGASSEPMPVRITDPKEFEPFFKHLANDGSDLNSLVPAEIEVTEDTEQGSDTHMLEFERGVLYADGRMDLCKQVLGPPNLPTLMDSLETNTFIRHFLFGNNIIGPHAAKRIAQYIKKHPDQIETWYLAGNCIDAAAFCSLVDALVESPSVTNVWLKRNPLGPESVQDIFRLICETPNLRTLDLDLTSLGDAGIAQLFTLLAEHVPNRLPSLRHLYLNACGAGPTAAKALSIYLASSSCTLTAIYLSCNPIGSTSSIAALVDGLSVNSTLERLVLQSTGLSSAGTVMLCSVLRSHPTLRVLDISNAYATDDLLARLNWITDGVVDAICDLVLSAPRLRYLDMGYTSLSQTGLDRIVTAIATENSHRLIYFNCVPAEWSGSGNKRKNKRAKKLREDVMTRLQENVYLEYGRDMSYERWRATERRFVIGPRDVRYIDSVYRNRDVYKARKGLITLKKRWEADERPLLEAVMGDADVLKACKAS